MVADVVVRRVVVLVAPKGSGWETDAESRGIEEEDETLKEEGEEEDDIEAADLMVWSFVYG